MFPCSLLLTLAITTAPTTQPLLAQDAPPREGPDAAVWWIDRCYAELRALEIPRREDRGSIGDARGRAADARRKREREEVGRPEPEGHLLMLGIVAKVHRRAGDEAGLARTEAWMNVLRKMGDPDDVKRYRLYQAWRDAPGPPRDKARAMVAAATQPLQRQEALRDVVYWLVAESSEELRGGPPDPTAARELLGEIDRPAQDRLAVTLVESLLKTGDVPQASAVFRGVTMLPPRELASRHEIIGKLALAQANAGRMEDLDYTLGRLRQVADAKLDREESQISILALVAMHDAQRAAGRMAEARQTLGHADELAMAMEVGSGGALRRLFGAHAAVGDLAATDRVIAAIPRRSAAQGQPTSPSDALLYTFAVLGQLEAGQFDAAGRTRERMRELGLRIDASSIESHLIGGVLLKARRVEELANVLGEMDAPERWKRLKALLDRRDDETTGTLTQVADTFPPPTDATQRLRAAQVYIRASQNERAAALLRQLLDDIRKGWKPPDDIYPGEILLAMREAGVLDAAAETARLISPAHLPAIARAYARAGDVEQAKKLIAERLAQFEAAPPDEDTAQHAVALATAAGAVGDQALFDRLIVQGNEAALKSQVQLWGGETGTWLPLCRAYRVAGRMKDLAEVVDRVELRPARAIVNLVAAQELSGIKVFDWRAPDLWPRSKSARRSLPSRHDQGGDDRRGQRCLFQEPHRGHPLLPRISRRHDHLHGHRRRPA